MKQGARTRLIPASAKGGRKVERRGETARPVAERESVYLRDIKDLLLVVGSTRKQMTRQASLFH